MHRVPDSVAAPVLQRAKGRLDRLDLYPTPVLIDRVRIVVFPLFFRIPPFRRFKGYALWRTILLRFPPAEGASDDLLTHELCHIWQGQHRRWHMLLTYWTTRYAHNPYECQARWAVNQTRTPAAAGPRVIDVSNSR